MSYPQANQAYTEAAVMSATPEQLVVMLYDGAIRFMQQGIVALDAGQRDMARTRLYRAETIINELNQTLNMDAGGDIAKNLRALYLWAKQQITEAVVEQDTGKVSAVLEQMRDLRDGWAQAAAQEAAAAAS